MTWDDLKAIQTQVPTVLAVAPALRVNATIVSEEQNWMTSVMGTTPDYFVIRSWQMSKGASITASDVESGAKIAVLGQTVVDKLYGPNADPIGQSVRIKNKVAEGLHFRGWVIPAELRETAAEALRESSGYGVGADGKVTKSVERY